MHLYWCMTELTNVNRTLHLPHKKPRMTWLHSWTATAGMWNLNVQISTAFHLNSPRKASISGKASLIALKQIKMTLTSHQNQMYKNQRFRQTALAQTEILQVQPSHCKPRTQGPTFNINTKVVAHFVQNEVYIFFCWYRMGRNISWAVRGACNSHLLPRQEENHSTITGGWVKQPHVVRAEIKKGHEQVRHHQRSVPVHL